MRKLIIISILAIICMAPSPLIMFIQDSSNENIMALADYGTDRFYPTWVQGAGTETGNYFEPDVDEDCYFDFPSSLIQQKFQLEFSSNTDTTVIRIFKEPKNSSFGSIVEIDYDSSLFKYYLTSSGTELLQIRSEITIPLIVGDRYILSHDYDWERTSTMILKNKQTGDSVMKVSTATVPRDYTGFVVTKGSARIYNFKYIVPNKKINLILWGNSITDGYSIVGDEDKRWVSLLYQNAVQKKIVVSGRAGDMSQQLWERITYDIQYFENIQNCVMLIGTNDGAVGYATWRVYYDRLLDSITSKGITPILATIPPRVAGTYQSEYDTMNSYILDTLSYPVVDFAAVLTVGRDRTTAISGCYLPDGVHPNVSGNDSMYTELVRTFPELLNY